MLVKHWKVAMRIDGRGSLLTHMLVTVVSRNVWTGGHAEDALD